MTRHRLLLAAIGLLIVFAYAQHLTLPLYADDYRWLRWAQQLHDDPSSVLVLEAAMFRVVLKVLYVPLYLLVHTNPLPYHLVDLLLMLTAAALACRLYGMLGLAGAGALAATLVHTLHPYRAGAFLICGSTTGLLNWALYLLAAILYLAYRRAGRRRDYLLAWVTFALSLFIKEDSVTLPAMLLVYELLTRDGAWLPYLRAVVRRQWPFWLFLLLFLGAEWSVQRLTYFVAGDNYGVQYAYHNYQKTMLGLLHPWWREINLKYLDLLMPLLALACLVFGGRRARFFAVWMYVTYAPFALLAWGHETRFPLIPSFGLAGLAGLGIEWLLAFRWPGYKPRQVVAILLTGFALVAYAGINAGSLPRWYVNEAHKTASFVDAMRTLRQLHGASPVYLLDNDYAKFIIPDFICPVEFPAADDLRCEKVRELPVRDCYWLHWYGDAPGQYEILARAAGQQGFGGASTVVLHDFVPAIPPA